MPPGLHPSLGEGAPVDIGRYWSNVFKLRPVGSITAGTAVAIWTPAAGKKFRLVQIQLSLSVVGQLILKDGGAEILRSANLAAGATWDFEIPAGLLSSNANNVLNVDTTATGNVGGLVAGIEE